MIGVGLSVPQIAGSSSAFTPLKLFSAGEQGAWYDPSDLTTMFQDSAGTTPVIAVEQPVGLIRDKSGRGNHASQSTPASRPVLSARVNLLTYSEQFDNAAWTAGGVVPSANTTTAPDGTLTADTIAETATNAGHRIYRQVTLAANTTATLSAYVKRASGTRNLFVSWNFGDGIFAHFNLGTGQVINTATAGTGTFVNATITSGTNGWYRITLSGIASVANANPYAQFYISNSSTDIGNTAPVYTGDGTSGIYIWGADLRVTNDGVGIPAYQRVTTATDYDTNGFPLYLAFDGVNDSLATSSIDFSATDKMSVFAGARKLSNTAQGVVAELTASIAANNGGFLLSAPNSAAANYNFTSKGTTQVDNTITPYTAPITSVITGQGNISAPSNIVRVNGTQVGSVATTQGTGNYANAALNIGRRGGATLPFNGRLYHLIVRGAQSTAAQIASTETYVNNLTKAY